MTDLAYWITHPLPPESLKALRAVNRGHPSSVRFENAWLVSQGLLHFDGEALSVTDKGRDALRYYVPDEVKETG